MNVMNVLGVGISASFFSCLLWGLLASAVCIALESAAVFGVSKLMKSQATFVDALIACGANSLFSTVLLLAAFLLSFLNLLLGWIFLMASMVTWMVMSVISVRAITPDADRGMVWIACVAATILVYAAGAWVWSMVLPNMIGDISITSGGMTMTIKEALGGVMPSFSDLLDQLIREAF